jgi:hypothetical protein
VTVRIAVRRSGGFANVGAHGEVDTASLPAAQARELERLAKTFPAKPPAPMRAAFGADAYQYDITIDEKSYRADDLSLPDDWRALVELVLERA